MTPLPPEGLVYASGVTYHAATVPDIIGLRSPAPEETPGSPISAYDKGLADIPSPTQDRMSLTGRAASPSLSSSGDYCKS